LPIATALTTSSGRVAMVILLGWMVVGWLGLADGQAVFIHHAHFQWARMNSLG
jgi:hypothetical protein